MVCTNNGQPRINSRVQTLLFKSQQLVAVLFCLAACKHSIITEKENGMSSKSKIKSVAKWTLIVVGAFFVLVIIIGIATSKSDTKKSDTNTQKPAETTKSDTISQSAAENYCEDAGLLGKYVDISNTSIVTLSYKPYYSDSGMKTSAGSPIYTLQWNGKDKSTDDSVLFVCEVSGTDKSITLNSLAINGKAVYGPVDEK